MKLNSKKLAKPIIAGLFIFVFSTTAFAQNVTVAGALVGNGSYATLAAAFTAINGGAQAAANISITIVNNTTETAAATLNAGTWASLTIMPQAASSRTISGSITTGLVILSDADNVLIDGVNSGGSALTFSNTSTGTAASTVRFLNGATNNTITNCTVLGNSNSATAAGNIHFSTSTTAGGNSINTISSCTIGPIAAGGPAIGVLSVGTAANPNTDNTIQNCVFADIFRGDKANYGIFVSSNSSRWTVSGNKFYQSVQRVYTGTAAVNKVIAIIGGDGYNIANNVIGYSSANATGVYAINAAIATRLVGIELNAGAAALSTVQNNTISAISLTTTGTTTSANGNLCGINILGAGLVSVSGNLIGNTSGINSFNLNPTGTAGWLVGINTSCTGTINISNNYLGAFTSTNTVLATSAGQIQVINVGAAPNALSVTNNTLGNPTPDNMVAGTETLTTANSVISGVNMSPVAMVRSPLISGNLIQNLTSYGTGTGGYARGIWSSNTSGSAAAFSILNNTITAIKSNNGNVTVSNALVGVAGIITAFCNTALIADNVISDVSNTNTVTTGIISSGIAFAALANINATPTTIKNNKIWGIKNFGTGNTATAPPIACGILIRAGNIRVSIVNNMISLGTGQLTNTSFIGIYGNHGGIFVADKIYHNTINIEGTVIGGSNPTFGFLRGDFSATPRIPDIDFKNNIITNNRTGGTGVHCAIGNNYGALAVSQSGWNLGASDYNVLNTANPLTVGWWGAATDMNTWKFLSGGDQHSYSGIPVNYVNSASDLHLNMTGTVTAIESGAITIAGLNNDIDYQQRPGPFVGAVQPDIGADEISAFEGASPLINYNPLGVICSTGDRTLTANITDATGIYTTGGFVPRIYFKKNTGSYFSTAGVLSSGTSNNGTWLFTISASAMGGLTLGDNVSYYIAAQDITPAGNTGANPLSGFAAVTVNSITTPPSTPNSYLISSVNLSGSYTVGTTGTYTTLTDAANAYNNACLTGPVTFVLKDALYSTAETFPVVFQNNITASATNSLLVIPAAGNAAAVTPTNANLGSVIKFLDARYITFDGLNTAGSSLAINNSNVNSTSANIWLASGGPGCNNIALKNMALTGGTVSSSNGVIASVDFVIPSSTAGSDNDNITIQGNTFNNFYNGIYAAGTASVSTGGLDNWLITGNIMGPAATSTNVLFSGSGVIFYGAVNCSVTANIIQNITTSVSGIYGVEIETDVNGFTVSQNTITNFFSYGNTNAVTAITAVYIGPGAANGVISSNSITNITSPSVDGYGARGININTGNPASNINITNNFVAGINSVADDDGVLSSYWPVGIGVEGVSTGGINIDFNSVNLYGVHPGYEGAVANAASAALVIGSGGGNINVRNNILCNTYGSTFTTTTLQDLCYAIYCYPVSVGGFPTINNNCYYVGGVGSPTHTPILGYLNTSTLGNLYALQNAFGQNLNSINILPQFVSADDLHLVTTSVANAGINNNGQSVSGITLDFDAQTRNVATPDIGADEFNATATCTSAVGGTISPASYSICTPQNLLLNSPNVSTGLGTSYAWKIGSAAGGPYTAVASGTGALNPTYSWNGLSPGTYYLILEANCASPVLTSVSNEVTVTINTGANTTSISSTNTFVCPGASVTLVGSGATSYTWSNGTTSTSATSSITVSPVNTTVYSFSSIVGSCISSKSMAISYITPPTLTVTVSSPTICAGLTSSLTVSGASTYTWNTGSNASSIVSPTLNTSTTYTVNGTDANGCAVVPVSKLVVVTNQPPILSVSGNTAVCAGQAANLSASGALSYTWDSGATTATIAPAPLVNTSYTVSGTDGYGCIGSTTHSVLIGNISVNISGPTSVCNGQPVNLSVTGGVTYTWSDGSNTSTISPTPTINTTYSVVGVSGTCSNSASKSITVNPTPSITISASDYTVCAGQTTTLTASGADTFTWNTTSTNTVINVAPTFNSNYIATGTNSLGCSSSTTLGIVANPLPSLTITATSPTVCLTLPVSYTVAGAASYTWNSIASGPVSNTFLAIPAASTTYTAFATTSLGCVGSRTVGVVTNTLPIVAITPTSATVCYSTPVSFTASGASTYTWNGTSTGAVFNSTPTASITHTVVGRSTQGCSTTKTVDVVVNPNPTLAISPASATVCLQSPTSFTASGAVTYTWNGTVQSTTASFIHSGNTTHTVVGTNAFNCSSSQTVGVATNPLPTVSIAPPVSTVCVLSTSNFTASGAATYLWFNASTSAVTAITPTATGSYSVIGTDANGCSAIASAVIVANPLPNVLITPPSGLICPSTSIVLTALGAGTYTWSHALGSNTAVVATPTITTTYTVNGTNITTGCTGNQTVTISTYSNPVLVVTPASATLCLNSSVLFTASGVNSYTWSNTTFGPITSVTPAANEDFTVTGTDVTGCVATKTVSVTVNPLPILSISPSTSATICKGEATSFTVSGASTYTWNPGGIATNVFTASPSSASFYSVDATDSKGCRNAGLVTIIVSACTGLSENNADENLIRVYPNPSSGKFSVEVNAMCDITIRNLLGALVYAGKHDVGMQLLDLGEKAKGIYILKLVAGSKTHNLRLVIE